MATYFIIHNRTEGPLAQTDDLDAAGRIVDALMRARSDREWHDYWLRADDADNGPEFYWDEHYATVFSAACFTPTP